MPSCCKALYFLICCCASVPDTGDDLWLAQDQQEKLLEQGLQQAVHVVVDKQRRLAWPFTPYVDPYKTPSDMSDQSISERQRRELTIRVVAWMQEIEKSAQIDCGHVSNKVGRKL